MDAGRVYFLLLIEGGWLDDGGQRVFVCGVFHCWVYKYCLLYGVGRGEASAW
jgi:hypothetical protein